MRRRWGRSLYLLLWSRNHVFCTRILSFLSYLVSMRLRLLSGHLYLTVPAESFPALTLFVISASSLPSPCPRLNRESPHRKLPSPSFPLEKSRRCLNFHVS